jgi:hypothetical protein
LGAQYIFTELTSNQLTILKWCSKNDRYDWNVYGKLSKNAFVIRETLCILLLALTDKTGVVCENALQNIQLSAL